VENVASEPQSRMPSAADLEKALAAGIDLPATKADMLRHAKENRNRVEPALEIIELL